MADNEPLHISMATDDIPTVGPDVRFGEIMELQRRQTHKCINTICNRSTRRHDLDVCIGHELLDECNALDVVSCELVQAINKETKIADV